VQGNGSRPRFRATQDWASPLAFDLDGDGALQQADGDDQAINLVRVGDDPSHTRQRAALDAYLRANAEEGPGLRWEPGTKDRSNGLNLFVVNRDGGLAGAQDAYHARRSQDRQASAHVKPAE